MATRRPPGMVFVSYAHVDRERVRPLVTRLSSRFNVWWDRGLQGGETWRRTLAEKIDSARCLVVVWTTKAVSRDFVWSEVQRAIDNRGAVLPVKLDARARIPLGFDQMQTIDLTTWRGGPHQGIGELMKTVAVLVARPASQRRVYRTLVQDPSPLRESRRATRTLLRLSRQVQTLGGILIPGNGPTEDLLGSLREVERTFDAVSAAITSFVAPTADRKAIEIRPYLTMERGSLAVDIERRRGHCARIVEYYGRAGGVRDWLEDQHVSPRVLDQADRAFAQLGESDNDLFAVLARIGDLLTDEAAAIAGLLAAGHQKAARVRILKGRELLRPLERDLREAQVRMQQIQSSLGYAPSPT